MGVGRVTRRAKEVFISKSVRPYRVSASTVVTLHCCCHPALSGTTVYRNQFSRSSQPWSSCGPAPVPHHAIICLLKSNVLAPVTLPTLRLADSTLADIVEPVMSVDT